MKIFIDTGIFIALIFTRESLHNKVVEQYEEYKQKRAQFITSDYILDEVFTRCVARGGTHGAKIAVQMIDGAISHNELAILEVDTGIFKKAKEIFLKFSEHRISFTDATSYVLLKEFALDEIFTLDDDFKKIRVSTSF